MSGRRARIGPGEMGSMVGRVTKGGSVDEELVDFRRARENFGVSTN